MPLTELWKLVQNRAARCTNIKAFHDSTLIEEDARFVPAITGVFAA
jgi:hypothetical protein